MKTKAYYVLLILLGLSILWLVAWFQNVKAYNDVIERARRRLGDEIVDKYYDLQPVWMGKTGALLLVFGMYLAVGWAFACYSYVKEWRKGKAKLDILQDVWTVPALLAPVFGFAVLFNTEGHEATLGSQPESEGT